MRVRADAAVSGRRERSQLRNQAALRIEEIVRPITQHPLLEELEMRGVRNDVRYRHLMRPPGTLHFAPIDFSRSGPPFGCAEHDHWPARSLSYPGPPRVILNRSDFVYAVFQGGGNSLMHGLAVRPFHKIRGVAVTLEKVFQLPMTNPSEDRRVIDLVPVQVEDR